MCGSVFAAVLGLLGSAYSFVISGFTLLQGPHCFTSLGWEYPFEDLGGRSGKNTTKFTHLLKKHKCIHHFKNIHIYTVYILEKKWCIHLYCCPNISICLVVLTYVLYIYIFWDKKNPDFHCHEQLFPLLFFQVSLPAWDLVKLSSTTSYCGMECDSAVHTPRSGCAGVHHLSFAAGERFS